MAGAAAGRSGRRAERAVVEGAPCHREGRADRPAGAHSGAAGRRHRRRARRPCTRRRAGGRRRGRLGDRRQGRFRGGRDRRPQRFLVGHDVPWVEDRRRDMEEVRRQALEIVAEAGIALGGSRLAGAEAAAQELVRSAPFRESAHAALMRRCAPRQRRRGARAYEELRTLLREELGTTPSPALVAQHEQLLGLGDAPAATGGVRGRRPAAAHRVARPARPGRRHAARRAPRGDRAPPARARPPRAPATTRLILLTGEGGIGKTRSVAEAARGRGGLHRPLRALRRGRAVPLRALDRAARHAPRRGRDRRSSPT